MTDHGERLDFNVISFTEFFTIPLEIIIRIYETISFKNHTLYSFIYIINI